MNNIAVKRSRVRGKRGNETRGDCGESLLERWKRAKRAKVGDEFSQFQELSASADWRRDVRVGAGGMREFGVRGGFVCAGGARALGSEVAERTELVETAGADESRESAESCDAESAEAGAAERVELAEAADAATGESSKTSGAGTDCAATS